jgi:predicted GH43/DUF377 family glycosyl hydrolase
MTESAPVFKLFEPGELILPEWQDWRKSGRVYHCNPSLLEDGSRWIFACRVIGPDLQRRVLLCRLDRTWEVIAGSHIAWSDQIRFPDPSLYPEQVGVWFADPRLFRIGRRLFIYWNSGWHEPQNHQFIQELDPASLAGLGPPRELVLVGRRRKIEKNWMIFGQDQAFAVYSPEPHRLLTADLSGQGPVPCRFLDGAESAESDESDRLSVLRGGAPPRRFGPHYYSFCHSIEETEGGYAYLPAVYRFDASDPRQLTALSKGPLPLPNPLGDRREHPPLNPAIYRVIYPSGAVPVHGDWCISYGINDERCAICRLPHEQILKFLRPMV